MNRLLNEKATAGQDLSQADDYTVTPTSLLDNQFVYTYLCERFNNVAKVLTPISPEAFNASYYANQFSQNTLTDSQQRIVVPFNSQDELHTMGLYVEYAHAANSKDPIPMIYWLNSSGNPMPQSVREAVDKIWTHDNKEVFEQVIKPGQQQIIENDGHNCGVYTALNFDEMIYGKGLKGTFNTQPESVLTNKRQEMVTVNNNAPETINKFTFVEDPNVERAMKASLQTHHDEKSWSKEKFVQHVSKDLLDFGASLQGSGTAEAFDDFDAAFDIAATAYQKALQKSSVGSNPHAFFNTYQGLSKQLDQQYEHNKQAVVEASKTCAQEAQEDVLEEGKDFFRMPGSTFA